MRRWTRWPVRLPIALACLLLMAVLLPDAAPAHLMHHRQQVNLEPVGGARALLVEDGVEALE